MRNYRIRVSHVNVKTDPLCTKDWVKRLARRKRPMTAHEIAKAREDAGDGKTYGPDVVTRLKNSRGIRVIPVAVPGKTRAKKYTIELTGE